MVLLMHAFLSMCASALLSAAHSGVWQPVTSQRHGMGVSTFRHHTMDAGLHKRHLACRLFASAQQLQCCCYEPAVIVSTCWFLVGSSSRLPCFVRSGVGPPCYGGCVCCALQVHLNKLAAVVFFVVMPLAGHSNVQQP
jgi:hypothetical protein